MSFNKLSQERIQFVRKAYFEIFNNAMSIAQDVYNNSSSNSSNISPIKI
ncbi:2755_t:CDS:1, partial [Entrophospora sp. SA101]